MEVEALRVNKCAEWDGRCRYLYGSRYRPELTADGGQVHLRGASPKTECRKETGAVSLEEDLLLMEKLRFNAVIFGSETLRYALSSEAGLPWLEETVSRFAARGIGIALEMDIASLPPRIPAWLRETPGLLFLLISSKSREEREALRTQLREAGISAKTAVFTDDEELAGMNGSSFPVCSADILCYSSNPDWSFGDRDAREIRQSFFENRLRGLAEGRKGCWLLTGMDPAASRESGVRRLREPGTLGFTVYHAAAHGAGGFFFRGWREEETGPKGGALISYDGRTDTPALERAEKLGILVEELQTASGRAAAAPCALLMTGDVDDAARLVRCFGILRTLCQSVDVIDESADFSRYSLIVSSSAVRAAAETPEKIRRFVAQGGIWLSHLSPMSEAADGKPYRGDTPFGLTDVFGMRICERDELPRGEEVPLEMSPDFRGYYAADEACEILRAEDAEVLGRYAGRFYSGSPALTRKRFGEGFAYYLAAGRAEKLCADLLEKILGGKKKHPRRAAGGLLIERLEDEETVYMFCLNYSERERKLPLEYNKLDVLFGYDPLPAYGAMVLKVAKGAGGKQEE